MLKSPKARSKSRAPMRLLVLSASFLIVVSACKTPNAASRLREGDGGGRVVTLIGNLPARYLDGADGKAFDLAAIRIESGVIRDIKRVTPDEATEMAQTAGTIALRPSAEGPYDV